MLKVTNDATCFSVGSLNDTLSPIENLTNSYNVGEQTCFLMVTVRRLTWSLHGILWYLKNLSKFVTWLVGLVGFLVSTVSYVRVWFIWAIAVAAIAAAGAIASYAFVFILPAFVAVIAIGLGLLFLFLVHILDTFLPRLNDLMQRVNELRMLINDTAGYVQIQRLALEDFLAHPLNDAFVKAETIYQDARAQLVNPLYSTCWTAEQTANPGLGPQDQLSCAFPKSGGWPPEPPLDWGTVTQPD